MAEQKQRYKAKRIAGAVFGVIEGEHYFIVGHNSVDNSKDHLTLELIANANLGCAASSIAEERDDAIEALKEYVKWFGPAHDQDCPGDDTCECSGANVNRLVNVALRAHTHKEIK